VEFSDQEGRAGETEWLTLGQAARFLGVAQSTIRKWSDQGQVPAFYTPGGHRRYRRADLERFLERSGPGGAQRSGPLVLLVDDDEKVRELVRINLEFEGYIVREAGSAAEGLAAIEDATPSLILLDVMMPQVDGWEMLRQIQERHGAGAIPVVMFSGQVEKPSEAEAQQRGARGFVGKPFDVHQLIEQTKQIVPT
jgi:excisionase family DNA binding protein